MTGRGTRGRLRELPLPLLLPLPPPRVGGRRSGCSLGLVKLHKLVEPGSLLGRTVRGRDVQESQELLFQCLSPLPPPPLLPHLLLQRLLRLGLLLLLQDSPCEEGEGGGVQHLRRLTSQERRGQRRHPGRRRLQSPAAYNLCSVSLRGPGSSRTPGRTPALAVFGLPEWCNAAARAIATVCRSCLAHERSRRSRRLLAAPAWSLMTTTEFREKLTRKSTCEPKRLVVVVVVVRTLCMTCVSIHARQR